MEDTVEELNEKAWKEIAVGLAETREIDCSKPAWRLRNLNGLTRLLGHGAKQVDGVNFSDGRLTSLSELEALPNLRRVIAPNNMLTVLEWAKMDNLMELDLSRNQLSSIPNIAKMPKLKVLKLSNNVIASSSFEVLGAGKNLEELDLRYNRLSWRSDIEFFNDTKPFSKLVKLKRLYLEGNPVVEQVQDYALLILGRIRSKRTHHTRPIERIDNYKVDANFKTQADTRYKVMSSTVIEASAAEVPQEEATLIDDFLGVEKGVSTIPSTPVSKFETLTKRNENILPSISDLSDRIEDCFNHSSECLKILTSVTKEVQHYLYQPDDQGFLISEETGKDASGVDLFIMNVSLLIERQPQVTSSLLRILVFLSAVQSLKLREACLKQLSTLMGGGESLAIQVISSINENMVPLLDQTVDPGMRGRISKNLIYLAKSPNVPDELQVSPLDKTLPYIYASLTHSNLGSTETFIEMAAEATSRPALARRLGGRNLEEQLSRELKTTSVDSPQYLFLIQIIGNLARFDKRPKEAPTESESSDHKSSYQNEEQQILEAENLERSSANSLDGTSVKFVFRSAKAFAQHSVHRDIIVNLKKIEEVTRQNVSEFDQLKQQSIICLSSLALSKSVFQDLLDSRIGYLEMLFAYSNMPTITPVVLSAVFHALGRILTSPRHWFPLRYLEKIQEKQEVFELVTKNLHRVTPLLQYLGERGSKFIPMCDRLIQDDLSRASRSRGATVSRVFSGEKKTLTNLVDSRMHALLVSIIDLITIYNREAAQPGNLLAMSITQEMNHNKRETFLFACLNTPSDEVKLAVVRCLQEIPLSEFENQEINYLVELLANTVNISAGKTEEVLGGSFSLLTKLGLSNDNAGRSFRRLYAEKTAVAALNILERNEHRDTRGQLLETYQKRILSSACVEFLQACSQLPILRNFMKSHEVTKKMISILYVEDSNSGYVKLEPTHRIEMSREDYRPCLVESTQSGRQVEYLLRTLVGFPAVDPTRVVAPRILRRMADVLSGIPDPTYNMVYRKHFGTSPPADASNQDNESIASDQTDAISTETLHRNTLPPWILLHMELNSTAGMDFRTLANRASISERKLSSAWNSLVGSQVGCDSNWTASQYLSMQDQADKLEQHQLFIQLSGLERLILFLVSAVDRTSGTQQFSNTRFETTTDTSSSAIGASSFFNVLRINDAKDVFQDVILNAQNATKAANDLESASLNRSAKGVSGKELLLRYFMQESTSGGESSATSESTEIVDVDVDTYPDADHVIIASRETTLFRRDTEVTETIIAGLRVIHALLRFGSVDTKEAAKEVLKSPSKFRLLALICTGSPEKPVWLQSLIGAKFMAIAYEICVMPGVRREEHQDMLSIYSIVCYAGKRIMSTLRFLAESRALSEADMVTAMHTTRTLALIASQIRNIRMRPPTGQVDLETQRNALVAVWRALFPFESTVKGCITLLVACSMRPISVARRNSGVELLDYLVSEQVTAFLVAAFSTSTANRYEVMEELIRTQTSGSRPLKSSYIQDLLHRVAVDAFKDKLQIFMGKSGIFAQSNPVDGNDIPEWIPVERNSIASTDSERKRSGSSSSFFSFCAAPRVKEQKQPKAQPIQYEPADMRSVRKGWLFEPPAALNYDALDSAKSDRQNWEYDRIGQERILVTTFADVYESGAKERRRLLVLTSEAYYLLGEPEDGRGWRVFFNAEASKSSDDVFTNPTLFATPMIFSRTDIRPVLLWRKPYRAVRRIVLGLFGERFHLHHLKSEFDPDRLYPVTLTVVTYIRGVASKIYGFFMQMCREWAKIEMSTGVDGSRIFVPAIESDIPLRDAIEEVMLKLEEKDNSGVASGGSQFNPFFSSKVPTNGHAHTRTEPSITLQNLTAGNLLEFPYSTGLLSGYKDVLLSQILLIREGQPPTPKIIISTSKYFALLDFLWEAWAFPVDFEARQKNLLAQMKITLNQDGSAVPANHSGTGTGWGKHNANLSQISTILDTEREKEMRLRKRILSCDAGRCQWSLLDLGEVFVDRGESPELVVGFGRAKASSTSIEGKAETYYKLAFYDHHTREVWLQRLIPELKRRAE